MGKLILEGQTWYDPQTHSTSAVDQMVVFGVGLSILAMVGLTFLSFVQMQKSDREVVEFEAQLNQKIMEEEIPMRMSGK